MELRFFLDICFIWAIIGTPGFVQPLSHFENIFIVCVCRIVFW